MAIESINASLSYGRAQNLQSVSQSNNNQFANSINNFQQNLSQISSLYAGEQINSEMKIGRNRTNNAVLPTFVQEALDKVTGAEAISLKGLSGKASIADVASAISQAEIALKELMTVREKFILALNDITKMSI